MTDAGTLACVQASAATLGLVLDEARARRVAAHLAQIEQMAQLLLAAPMGAHAELAGTYAPLAFPSASDTHTCGEDDGP
ncbi:DUF4089 domain-containing protein [Verminephrobacter aporrectodeae subsp. tuberculatae]|uniref:DUF4089 domain-containing protein n=1 Tax=Verminephrobacter aporrectodeae TaxID=1110389 RepID=UPI0022374FC0|nr:DUF4089 domain-containing protein [Verminephrobacter aporrectodeae]MCW5258667.1 DUF4089 domain-containing protein [Verminephrobacter aporrectodeae subsp. tuberculatae]